MQKSKQGKFLLKYASLALGASVAAGASLGAQAQGAATGADPGPSADAKAPAATPAPGGGAKAGASQVPISVVYGPPASMRGVGSIKGSSPIKGTSKIALPEKPQGSGAQPAPSKPGAPENNAAGESGKQ